MASNNNENLPLGISLKANFVRYHILITLSLSVLLLASGYFVAIKPKVISLQQNGGRDLEVLRVERVKRQAYLAQLQDVSKKYHQFDKNQLDNFSQILPSGPDFAGLFVQLQSLAAANSLILSNVNFNESVASTEEGNKNDDVKKIGIGLNVAGTGQGSYNQLKAFIFALENNLRLFDVQAVYFNPGSPNYSLTLTAYYLGQ